MTALDTNAIVFHCIEVRQPIGTFYVGALSSRDLAKISYADVRRIREGLPRDVEEFSGIQRPLSESRVQELRQYVTTVDASFPTSIIVAVRSNDAEFDPKGVMKLRNAQDVAKIIDGQHRIAGLEGYKGPPFEMNVTIFIDMDIEDQALLFATINLKQTKVNKSLAYDLYEFATVRSPQKTAHNIARLLNSKDGSPFYQRIKILGVATGGRDETITQAGFVDRLLPLLSNDPMGDRDALKRGRPLPDSHTDQALPFRRLFAEDRDAEIAKNIWNLFDAVRGRWPDSWASPERGMVLNRTTGFSALMRFLGIAFRRLDPSHSRVIASAEYGALLRKVQIEDRGFSSDRYLPGSSGQSRLLNELLAGSGLGEA